MTSESINWDEDLFSEPEEEYQALVRTLRRKKGFGLFFVRCSPAEGDRLVVRVKADLSQKKVEFLEFDKPIDNLYEIVAKLPNREQINILFIQGLEHSFYEYENLNFGENSDRYNYNWKGVPQILNHLNQQRERFRDDFNNICFVFLLRSFSIKYFIRRAPDFFDWRSGVFEFSTNIKIIEQESSRILFEGDYQKYLALTREERIQRIIEIQELLEEDWTSSNKVSLLFKLGNLQLTANKYQEAIATFDRVLKIKPNSIRAWNYRGYALNNLGRYEEAIASYDRAIEINPNYDISWNNRGYILNDLERYQEAIASCDRAIQINPNYDRAWYNRSNALRNLGRYEEAIASFDRAIEINPNYDSAWYCKACCYTLQGNLEQAIENLQRAIELNPEKYRQMAKNDPTFDAIREDERFQKLIQGISEEN
ncbi:tetratricopeptide repeat protein [Chroococcidiopsis sp. CCNUC1]|uniref:tetratricopeptide repeat protein n=1 Tax=Chroococcidiopsis sp. CCNUC1 TaxID=2653189 RepID=UPI002020BBB1|nr:tetratricopeptide repeat protein [Chroococcidiopsis sp. CCNUC1]URD49117.1 tetratricopeptide repeat protein [Chroococcidiopsis sp. CCNUC1]